MSQISDFPARYAFTNSDGTLTTEARRMLRAWFTRIGGSSGASVADIELLSLFEPVQQPSEQAIEWAQVVSIGAQADYSPPDLSAVVFELVKEIDALKLQIQCLESQNAELAQVKRFAQDLDISALFTQTPTDWEHPGKIGAKTANAGTFTSVTTAGGATFHTTNTALTDGAGAGAGTITNAPAAGNPTKWLGFSDNGTTRFIPSW